MFLKDFLSAGYSIIMAYCMVWFTIKASEFE